MCGIVGVFNHDDATNIALSSVKLTKQRGSDSFGATNGTKVISDSKITGFTKKVEKLKTKNILMHTLNKISGREIQPFKSKGFFACECEIYNWKQLAKKHGIKANNDADFLMQFFEMNYPKTLDDFYDEVDGPFALAYWSSDKVVIARDLVGIKPLCYKYDKKSFMIASENKALDNKGKILEPTKIITYNLKTKKLTEQELRFYSTKPTLNHYKKTLIDEIKEKIEASIDKRTKDVNKFGLLFSGGVDSSIIASIAKAKGKNIVCYNAVFDHKTVKMPQDVEFAKKVAKDLKVPMTVVKVGVKATEEAIKQVIDIIETNDPVLVGQALPLYLAAEQARKDRVKVLLTPRGAEEIFAGYNEHREAMENGEDVNRASAEALQQIHLNQLYKDDTATTIHNIELRCPFLDKGLVSYAIKIPPKFKIDDDYQKVILREVALELGLRKDIAFRRTQHVLGSDFTKGIETLSKKKGLGKQEFMDSL